MKKISWYFLVIVGLLVVFALYYSKLSFLFQSSSQEKSQSEQKSLVKTTFDSTNASRGRILFGQNAWTVEIARTNEERSRGLSGRSSLSPQTGLLFVFNETGTHLFWMKEMLFNLDLVFFDENWQIILVEKNLSQQTFPQTFGGQIKSRYVLEINAGEAEKFGLTVGERANFVGQ